MSVPGPRGRWSAIQIVLLAIAALGLLVRIPSIAEPLSVDQGLLASAAKCLSRGMLLYRDVFDQKPPAIYYTYLAGFEIFGWRPASVTWLDILASAATTVLVGAIVRRIATRTMALAAAALYSALTIPAWVQKWAGVGERSVAENFIVVWIGLAAWCAVRLSRRTSVLAALGLGASVGAAMLYKPNAGLYLPALLIWLAYVRPRPVAWGAVTRVMLLAIGGAAAVGSLALLWIWRSGAGHDAWVAIVDFNRYYVSQNLTFSGFLHAFYNQIGFRVKTDPLWLAAAAAALVAVWDVIRARHLDSAAALAVAWGGASAVMIASNGSRFFPTYFILAGAPLAILAAWMLTTGAARPFGRAVAVATLAAMCWPLAAKNYPVKIYTSVAADWQALLGRGDPLEYLQRFGRYNDNYPWSARADEEVNAYVRDHTQPGDTIYQFGINDSGIYFATDRLPAAKFLRVNMFVPPGFPAPDFQLRAVLASIAARKPAYLIFEHFQGKDADLVEAINRLEQDADVGRLLASYRLDTRIEDFTLYRRIE